MKAKVMQCLPGRWSTWMRFAGGAVVLVVALVMYSLGAAAAPVAPGPSAGMESGGNPAAIGVQAPTFRLMFTPFDLTFSNNTWPLAKLDHYLDKYIPEGTRRQFIDDIPGGSFRLSGRAMTGVQLGIGPVSASFGVRALAGGGIAEDVLGLVFLGNQLDVPYSLNGTSFEAALLGDTAIGFSLPIGDTWRVGARYHKLLGLAYGHVEAGGTFVIRSDEPGIDGRAGMNYAYTHLDTTGGSVKMAGDGSAFDVGVSYQVTPDVAVGAAIMDWGQLRWDAVTSRTCDAETNGSGGDDLEELLGCTDEVTGAREWALPRRYEASVGWRMSEKVHVGAAYTYTVAPAGGGFSRDAMGGGSLRAAVTWDLFRFLQLNAAANLAGSDGLSVSTGGALRLGPMVTRARVSNVQVLFGEGSGKSMGFGMDMGIVF